MNKNKNNISKVILCALCMGMSGTAVGNTSNKLVPASIEPNGYSDDVAIRVSQDAAEKNEDVQQQSPVSTQSSMQPKASRGERFVDAFGGLVNRAANSQAFGQLASSLTGTAGNLVQMGGIVANQAIGNQLPGQSVKNSLTKLSSTINSKLSSLVRAIPTKETIDLLNRNYADIENEFLDISGKIHTAVYANGAAGIIEAEKLAVQVGLGLKGLANGLAALEAKLADNQANERLLSNELTTHTSELRSTIRDAERLDQRTLMNHRDDIKDYIDQVRRDRPSILNDTNRELRTAFSDLSTSYRKLDQIISNRDHAAMLAVPVVQAPAPIAPSASSIAGLIQDAETGLGYFKSMPKEKLIEELGVLQDAVNDFEDKAAQANASGNPIVKSFIKKMKELVASVTVAAA